MKRLNLIILGLLTVVIARSQELVAPGLYAVYFKDKAGTEYTVSNPREFLSQKALDRRAKYNITITNQDLPVSPNYLQQLKDKGFKVLKVSKWLNCAIVTTDSKNGIKKLEGLDFIIPKPAPLPKNYKPKKVKAAKIKEPEKNILDKYDYGFAANQVKMLNINKLHSLGYDGSGITMAIMDAGFFKVDSLEFFDSLRIQNRLLGWYDFVDMDTTVFNTGYHGMEVLSTIAGLNNGFFVGTAPKAQFYLFRTEDENSEYPIEEYNYVCALEKADSLGVDIVHSSLGYNDFDNDSLSYSYEDMNGNTAISTIGADIAAAKGMIVVASAGNEGDNTWKYISAPADADSIFAIGAVDLNGKYVDFSSRGPSVDKRIKPDVCAQGRSTRVASPRKGIMYSSGTSFSGPIIAGCMACLRQAFPDKTNIEIMNAVRATASHSKKPDDLTGYGIPDFYKAYLYLLKK